MTFRAFHFEPLDRAAYDRSGWSGLAGRASSFFQTPLWIETWLDHLPPNLDLRLGRLGAAGAPDALAVVGRSRLRLRGGLPLPLPLRRSSLMESGDPDYDRLAVEFNAPLLREPAALAPFLDGLLAATRRDYELLAARCDPATAEGLQAAAGRRGRRFEIYRGAIGWLCELPPAGESCYLDRLGRSTRQTVRRTRRRLEAEGALVLEAATEPSQALAFFAELRALHERTWAARGDPGAFASPRLVAFHERLIARGLPDAVHLLRLRAGRRTLGYLYNFQHGRRVYQYQAGLDYPEEKGLSLGLLAHVLAIEHHRRAGARLYDFLAGDARYKQQLATRSYELPSCRIAAAGLLGLL